MRNTDTTQARASSYYVVGVAGFEPTTFRSQSGRATKLRHTPPVRHVGYMPYDALRAARRSSARVGRHVDDLLHDR